MEKEIFNRNLQTKLNVYYGEGKFSQVERMFVVFPIHWFILAIVGSIIIYTGQQEVLVANEKVMYNSKIIVTPVGSNPVNWVISDKINGEGFKIKLEKLAEFDIAFDYWVIGVE